METALIGLTIATTAVAAILVTLSFLRPRAPHDDVEPVVGVQRHGRTYYVPRSLIDEQQPRGIALFGAGWRIALLALLGGSLLLTGLLRLI